MSDEDREPTATRRPTPGEGSNMRSVLFAAAGLAAAVSAAAAQDIRVGVLYDLSGPFAAAGSVACSVGAQIAVEMMNEKGGVLGKHKIVAVNADAQSKADVAINEAERLINAEKVDILLGVYSSAHAVPIDQRVDAQKKIFWITTAVATAVVKDRNLQYTFRPTVHSDQYGLVSTDFVAAMAKPKLGMDPKDVKVAIIYEDGPYGAGVASSNEIGAQRQGMQIVLKEGYSATAPDLSSLVTKLRRARPDVILHTGYNPDITLFLRQSREQGLRFKALIGHGAGYGQIDKLIETFGKDVDHVFNVDPVAAQLLDPKTLKPGVPELTAELVRRYKAKTGAKEVPPHASMGFNQSWILFDKVLPVAIEKYGSASPEAIRKAALDVDIPVGGTVQGYGVKFFPPGSQLAGQNERSSPVVMQYVGGVTKIAWPRELSNIDPVVPLPATSPYAMR
ncbi:MAG: ABC transporter substrate-binding protein [Alphaproteobacteria bacterium]|nr:ABC transporter substrate-binding protein [Alphaproteobacteria bacterium]